MYNMCYNYMLDSLKTRALVILKYVENHLQPSYFITITTNEDMENEAYQDAYMSLSYAREAIGAQYLYTATYNTQDELIYHIDGLPLDHEDFRMPGELIEPEFQEDIKTALSGESIMSGDILHTEWGDVFLACYPFYSEDGQVVGAIGVEFAATAEYELFSKIRVLVPGVITLTCLIASMLSRILFRRISNPKFRDIYNTDAMTGLKNRIAYDIDIKNFMHRGIMDNYTLVLADLNGLKPVNDKLGHNTGDKYIKISSDALSDDPNADYIVYRIGGDEFAILFAHQNIPRIEEYIVYAKLKLVEFSQDIIPSASMSMGMAICMGNTVKEWEKTQELADAQMYADKEKFYEQTKRPRR
ncbi:MAG: hypothetical protein BEN19_04350 [Epulopiscium sp. Nuni2H_MBin003]|nr:MAG: hypothetical protein BEN19_04350 [Epulopiscium sp. Nuni2H_MBin003]